jgi:hypothetical protein
MMGFGIYLVNWAYERRVTNWFQAWVTPANSDFHHFKSVYLFIIQQELWHVGAPEILLVSCQFYDAFGLKNIYHT